MTEAKKAHNRQRYLERQAEGRCVDCGEADDYTRQGRARCAACDAKIHPPGAPRRRTGEQRERENAAKRDWRSMLKAANLCVDCKAKDARTLDGKCRCRQCANRRNERNRANRDLERESAQHRERRERYRAAGRCTECGRVKEDPDRGMCTLCTVRNKLRCSKRRMNNSGPARGANGRCYQCNKAQAMEGKRLCPDCYRKKIATLNANRSALKEKAGQSTP